jgi:hypothetical protein
MENEQQMNKAFKILFMTLMTHACAWINIIAQKPVVPKSSVEHFGFLLRVNPAM